jgi:RimJ/RimL family protein N-acetyltransferase
VNTALPVLRGTDIMLRELETADAESLMLSLATDTPREFIPAPPSTVEGFERFITISRQKRDEDRGGCYGVIPRGADGPVGLFQFTLIETAPRVVEWGFILGNRFWGTGVFAKSAALVLDFLFDEYGVERVQGRCAVENARATAAFRKLGATPGAIRHEGTAFFDRPRDGQTWTIVGAEWYARRIRGVAIE